MEQFGIRRNVVVEVEDVKEITDGSQRNFLVDKTCSVLVDTGLNHVEQIIKARGWCKIHVGGREEELTERVTLENYRKRL